MSSNTDHTISEVIDGIIEHEEAILNNKELIETAFRENTSESEFNLSQNDVGFGISLALSSNLDNEGTANVGYFLLNFVSRSSTGAIRELQQRDISRELTDFLIELTLKYQLEVGRISSKRTQGANYWSNIASDIVLRPPEDSIGFTHRITLSYDRDIEIDANIRSTLALVEYFLSQEIEVIDIFDDDALESIDSQTIDTIAEQVEYIRGQLEEHNPDNAADKENPDHDTDSESA